MMRSRNPYRFGIFLLVFVLCSLSVLAVDDFFASSPSKAINVCACSTVVSTIQIKDIGTGTAPIILTLDQEGSAAGWSSVVPDTLQLSPNDELVVEDYISAPCDARGTYTLDTYIESQTVRKVLQQEVVAKACPQFELEPVDFSQSVCPCSPASYSFIIRNNADYTETFSLTMAPFTDVATFSEDTVRLGVGEERLVFLYVTPQCGIYGEYDIGINMLAERSQLEASTTFDLEIDSCYDYSLAAGQPQVVQDLSDEREHASVIPSSQKVELCEQEKKVIPVALKNNAGISNNYELSFDGPAWAHLSSKTFGLKAGDEAIVEIALDVPKGSHEGNFTLAATTERGDVERELSIAYEVTNCFNPAILAHNDVLRINYSVLTVPIMVKNTGEMRGSYSVTADVPDWFTLIDTFIVLNPGEEGQVRFRSTPTNETKRGKYPVTFALVSDDNKVSYAGKVTMKLAPTSKIMKALESFMSALKTYLWYLVAGLIIMVALIVGLLVKKRLPKKKKVKKKPKKKKEKKVTKKAKPTKAKKGRGLSTDAFFILITFALILLGLIGFSLYWTYYKGGSNFVYVYRYYVLGGVVLGILVVIVMWLLGKKDTKGKKKELSKQDKLLAKERKKLERERKKQERLTKKLKQEREQLKKQQKKSAVVQPEKVAQKQSSSGSYLWISLIAIGLLLVAGLVYHYSKPTAPSTPVHYTDALLRNIDHGQYHLTADGSILNTDNNYILSRQESVELLEASMEQLVKATNISASALAGFVDQFRAQPSCQLHLIAGTNSSVDLSRMFSDPEGNSLRYRVLEARHVAVRIAGNEAHIRADRGFDGVGTFRILAEDVDGAETTSSSIKVCVEYKNVFKRLAGFFTEYRLYLGMGVVILLIVLFLTKYNKKVSTFLEGPPKKNGK